MNMSELQTLRKHRKTMIKTIAYMLKDIEELKAQVKCKHSRIMVLSKEIKRLKSKNEFI